MLKCIHTKTKKQGLPCFFIVIKNKIFLFIYFIDWNVSRQNTLQNNALNTSSWTEWNVVKWSGEISTIICLQIIVSPVKDLYNKKNLYAITTNYTKDFFFYIVCIFDTFTFANAKVWDLSTLVEMTYKEKSPITGLTLKVDNYQILLKKWI